MSIIILTTPLIRKLSYQLFGWNLQMDIQEDPPWRKNDIFSITCFCIKCWIFVILEIFSFIYHFFNMNFPRGLWNIKFSYFISFYFNFFIKFHIKFQKIFGFASKCSPNHYYVLFFSENSFLYIFSPLISLSPQWQPLQFQIWLLHSNKNLILLKNPSLFSIAWYFSTLISWHLCLDPFKFLIQS